MQKKMVWFYTLVVVFLPSLLFSKMYYHSNGTIAWDGSKDGSVYHSNGQIAWDGSKNSSVYHSNGEKAWDGSKYSSVYHSNRERVWYGSKYGTVYHSNGKRAWGGSKYGSVYHNNGERAWDDGKIYLENGKSSGKSDSFQIWVSNEWVLTVQRDGSFYLAMPITDELWFYINDERVSLEEVIMTPSFNTVHQFKR